MIKHRLQGKDNTYIKSPFKKCDVKQFRDKGLNPDEAQKKKFVQRICPDMDHLKDFYRVLNGYTNKTERVNFSIEVHRCTDPNDNCESDEEIAHIVPMFYFTRYALEEIAELGSAENLGKRPTIVKDVF